MKKNAVTIIIAALLLVIFVLLLFTFQVPQAQVVVVSRFQEPIRTINEPGLYVKWPWPIDSINRFDQRVQMFEDQLNQTLLADNSTLLTSVFVGWRISDAKAFLPKFPGGSAAAAQLKLQDIVSNAKVDAMARHGLPDLVNADPSKLKFEEIEKQIRTAVEAQLVQNNYGISIEFLGIKRIGLPETVTATVFARMKAERKKYVDEAESDGKAQADKIKFAADHEAAGLITSATGAATRIQSDGEAEALKTLGVFQQNPQLALFELRLKAIQESLSHQSTLIFDERMPPFNLFQDLSTNGPAN
jgi:membrane protease subunit HflC